MHTKFDESSCRCGLLRRGNSNADNALSGWPATDSEVMKRIHAVIADSQKRAILYFGLSEEIGLIGEQVPGTDSFMGGMFAIGKSTLRG